jgi:alpha-L-arabinofuranosidase
VQSGEVFVLGDADPQRDSEAMNSRDQPDRVGVRSGKVNFSGSGFDYNFAPFTVTLLELQMRARN